MTAGGRGTGGPRRLAVVGWPIEHSLSPVLQGAAAAELGLDWRCERRPVASGELAGFVDVLDGAWLGLSVTAPLKEEAARLAMELDARAVATGAANTLLLGERLRGWNTDVGGIVRAFADAGLGSATTGAIAGAGATAQSALLALAELGAGHVTVALRTQAKGARLVELGARLGVTVELQRLDRALPGVDAAVSTLPAAAAVQPVFAEPPVRLLDADYARASGSRFAGAVPAEAIIDGRAMLLGQAVLQARIFVSGDVDVPLPDEGRVVDAMRAAMLAAAATSAATGVAASASLEES